MQWWVGQAGDPAVLIQDFLCEHDLLRRELAAGFLTAEGGIAHPTHPVCGAAVWLSAAACAVIAGLPPGPPTPAPAVPDVVVVVYEHASPAPEPPVSLPVTPWEVGEWRASWSEQEHAQAVAAIRDAIAHGEVYQVNLVGHWQASYQGDPARALARIAALPGAQYGGVLSGSGWAVATASPECLLRITNDRIQTHPIKGTRPATAAGRAELLASTKERAEHVMIVDLERNDLARIARTGTVRVERLYAVRRWCQLWQAESVVSARLAEGVDLAAVLRALCPGGSVVGAPKQAALEVIHTHEPVGRGPSMGAAGYLTTTELDLGLTIRTVAVDADAVHVWAGGGITWGSDPALEVAEAASKAAPLWAAVSSAATGGDGSA